MSFFKGLLLLSALNLAACGGVSENGTGTATDSLGAKSRGLNGTVDFVVKPVFEEKALQTKILTKNVTVRIWKRNAESGTNLFFRPAKSLPSLEEIPGQTPRSELSTASGEGQPFLSDTVFAIRELELNKPGAEVGIEFLEKMSDGIYYVIAYGVYKGPKGILSVEQLKNDLGKGLKIYSGRSCGSCATQELIPLNAPEALFQERCGSGVSATRPCDWQ